MANYTKRDQRRAEMLKPYLPAPARAAAHPPKKRSTAAPARPVATLAQIRAHGPWVWMDCAACRRHVPVPIAPWMIRWGCAASTDVMRERSRCSKCGHVGALIYCPSIRNVEDGFPAFPVT